ncbi:hypothetical protein HYPSUDRAFT_467608 [Hypholoma sublateritium FD-334 SS-4]|uniref:Uncharacterized protein n=1 Tax=Hypholoma sublateritium (strain FD-334 SS-4) TaxID=945553 RepID=A0A0D2NZX4_HYPSF|nr:hypothetical protein HYPSUDRAFT_467608 [Hypholoma sublateritium FD-334 SS-4]
MRATRVGSPGSGKTSIVKQMQLMHNGCFSAGERSAHRSTILRNVVHAARDVARYMERAGLECVEEENQDIAGLILDFELPARGTVTSIPSEIVDAIDQLWRDPVCRMIVKDHAGDFCLMDSAPYFFDEVRRIGAPGYEPTDDDVLRAWETSVGIRETAVAAGDMAISIFDVSGRGGVPRKWIHCFDNVESVIFCMALSEYDEVIGEEKTQNRMAQSLALFETVVNSRWFARTPITLFLNKVDVLEQKLAKVPLEEYFPDYTGGADVDEAVKFIRTQFTQVNRAGGKVQTHLTQVTDTTSFKAVITEVQRTIRDSAQQLRLPVSMP